MLDLAGEPPASFTTPDNYLWSGVTLPWMSTGYEVEMTPLQILTIYNAVANGGKMMEPKLVQRIESNGFYQDKDIFLPKSMGVICSEEVSNTLINLMEGVVLNGTAKNIQSDFLKLAGKTGTTQINYILRDKEDMKYQTSFAGFFPAEDPKYSCIVVINNPKTEYYANKVAAPVFKDVAEKIYNLDFDLFSNKINTEKAKKYVVNNKNIITQNKISVLSNYFEVKNSKSIKKNISNITTDLQNGIVPNMKNHNASDASYILNNNKIKTEISGRGKVVRQIPIPGSSAKGLKTIKLFLM
jgi:cell division protein FtsI (penicillin-binding protein 3)